MTLSMVFYNHFDLPEGSLHPNPFATLTLPYTTAMPSRLSVPHGRLASLAITAMLSLLLLVVPVYSSGRTLVQVNGSRVFAILAIPIIIALAPMIFAPLKISAAIAMFLFSFIAGFSVGLFYLP